MKHSPRSTAQPQASLADWVLVAALVFLGAASRIWFRDVPNFQPVAALGLFAGYYLRQQWLAVLAPLAALALSDAVIGGYTWQMMVVVYALLALPALAGPLLRKLCPLAGDSAAGLAGSLAGLTGASLLCAIAFFLATNFAWWPWSTMYEKNFSGLVACYLAGLPFFKYTLAANVLFGGVLFGGLAAAVRLGWRSAPVAVSASAAR